MDTIQDSIKYDDINTIPDEFKPFIFKLNINDKKLYNASPITALNYDYPLFSLGFQQFFHANIKRFNDTTNEFIGRKKIYHVMNLFDTMIDNYDAGIKNVTNEYFSGITSQIMGKDFYKLWEILTMFNIITPKSDKLISINIDDDKYVGTQAVTLCKNLISKNSKDEHYVIGHSINEKNMKKMNEFEKNNKNIVILPYITDLITNKNINNILKKIKNVNLAIAHTNVKSKNPFVHEQEALNTIIFEILLALKLLNNNGHFICKIFETYTRSTCSIIYILSQCFDEVYIVKPLTSYEYSSEKYIVCKNYNQKNKIIEQFENLQEILSNNVNMHIISVFPTLQFPEQFINDLTKINVSIANTQVININKIISFILEQNYYGEDYSVNRMRQITANTYWENMFLPNKGDIKKMYNILKNIYDSIINKK
jgi:23S rRNA U2552 (ribose-2'-O)-methylase RlmE/FtsJ